MAQPVAVPDVPAEGGVVLFFAPEAGITPHFAAQCIMAKALKELGHRVLFVRCFELFERCPVMDMYRLPHDAAPGAKTDICLRCGAASLSMLDAYGLDAVDLRSFLTPELQSRVGNALQELPADWREFYFDSIAFGRLAAVDLIYATKILNIDAPDSSTRDAWHQYIESSLLAYLLVDQLCARIPVKALVHFNDYALMLSGRLAARKHNIPSVSTTLASHVNIDRRRYLILPTTARAYADVQIAQWPVWRELSLTASQVKAIADDLLVRLGAQGSHLYSPAKTFDHVSVRAKLNLSTDKRLLVAYTSSLDEAHASQMAREGLNLAIRRCAQPFADQIKWLTALTRFVEARDDVQLVVRIHPREGANKRESVVSQHLHHLQAAFDRPYERCRFVWPADPISSYDLAEAADLVLTSWSTIGVELARLGAPVLASTRGVGVFPQDDFLQGEETRQAYFETLESLLTSSVSLERIAHAFRWYNLLHLGNSLDLSDVVPASNFEGLPPFKMPREARAIEDIIVKGADVLELNLARQRAAQHADAGEEEGQALQRQLRRIIHFLHTGADLSTDFTLRFAAVAADPEKMLQQLRAEGDATGTHVLVVHRSHTFYSDGRNTYRRYSPMCARLAPLCTQEGVSAAAAQRPPSTTGALNTGLQ